MNNSAMNFDFANSSYFDKDVLSNFKKKPETNLSIHEGMTDFEISDFVSEKLISVVKKQFEETKSQFRPKSKKSK
ncbi:MAG: hypothetical protein IPN99_00410 [Bacteroidetes bacterium]|nr:hypothetical protein [Bacteroidota bacterium]